MNLSDNLADGPDRMLENQRAMNRAQAALRALAECDQDLKAPALVEFQILQQFRAAQRQRAWRRTSGYLLAAAAGIAVILWMTPRQSSPVLEPIQVSQGSETGIMKAGGASTAKLSAEAELEAESRPTNKPPIRRTRRASRPVVADATPREIVTEFFPLMDAPPPMERGELWRVTVPASTMRAVGLPVNPDRWTDRVQADVLVGQEGMARAIRFVSFEY